MAKLLSNEFNLIEISEFIQDTLNITMKREMTKRDALDFLSRPLRVCVVVENTGEPGSGPFVVDNGDYLDIQICETSAVDMDNPEQMKSFHDSEFFNPVGLVRFVKDCKDDKFNLLDNVNEDCYFISEKSYEGRPLKALEHRGFGMELCITGIHYLWKSL